ncbi:MAG: ribonuclease E/G [bacterium]|nr:ribonuclease E/G [bacterium]
MSRRLFVTKINEFHNRELLVSAIYDNDRMIEATCQSVDTETILNNIYVGRVSQVVSNIHAAFVEITPGIKCYLPLSDLIKPVYVKRISSKKPLVQGDEILVQVVRDAVKTKDPVVSTNLSIAGTYCVATSETCGVGVSKKLNRETRAELLLAVKDFDCEQVGLIIRTNAANTDASAIRREAISCIQELNNIITYACGQQVFSCVYHAPKDYVKLLADQPLHLLDEVVTDLCDVYEMYLEYAKADPSTNLVDRIRYYEDPQLDLNKLYSIEHQLEQALQKKIWLKSGANIIIEPTEAMTVIDVNSSKNDAKTSHDKNALKINLEAAKEIALQMRLRNLSGIIIVDFMDLNSMEDQQLLLKELKHLTACDSVPTTIVDITPLGLVEITRKKIKRSLYEQINS